MKSNEAVSVKIDMASHAIRRLFISLGLLAYGTNTGTKL